MLPIKLTRGCRSPCASRSASAIAVDAARLAELGRIREQAAKSARRYLRFAPICSARGFTSAVATFVPRSPAWSAPPQPGRRSACARLSYVATACDDDPDARRLRELLAATEGPTPTPTHHANANASENARSVEEAAAINKRLNSELRLPRLLEMILDTVIELTDAERGFLLLEDGAGAWRVEAARDIDQRR